MIQIYKYIVRVLGLKGSWSWACRRMKDGYIVKMKSTVAVHHRLDLEGQGRIQWSFNGNDWEDAKVFLKDLRATDWNVYNPLKHEMTYKKAKIICHVRSAIFRTSNPSVKYWKNHPDSTLDERVPDNDKGATDWKEYDPRDDDNCSLFMFND